ncbi:protein bicaudal C homolog 1 isoform X3 [Rhineura floridana]|uniref:protein bicaudal C homolog 1 isoform X3 n=1 Tax=Rhineura floridana TaxID=261503 RepID=UPI002AC81FB9|nr:protein bicaudal C homolog 1 isoform X3 [Rhineura floridana]
MEEAGMLCGLRAGWGRSRAAAGPGQALCTVNGGGCCGDSRALGRECELEAGAGAGGTTEALAGWDEAGGGRLWGQIASRGGGGSGRRGNDGCCYCCCAEEAEGGRAEAEGGRAVVFSASAAGEWGSEQLGGGATAGGGMAAPQGYPLSDPGSNSERSADSPLPDDGGSSSAGPARAHSASPEWGEERFRVDRKKLEAMLQAAAEGKGKSGEDFFQKIMEETNTQIAWPSKLKIGAKSKKDPHIKVSGKKENVKEAKEKIMSVLDTKSNRVTLKMDVSHTEHSHVIGKGGNNIKKVMEETGCHIHFPDSNRNNQAEKSNQVSIAGQPAGVESARVRIRELLPLVLMFELPIAGILQPIPDPSSPTIQHISQTYNISVSFKQRSRTYGATVIIRGSQNNASSVKEGTAMLLEHLAGSLASAIPVSTQLDIAAQHHLFMMGRNGSNIKHIMQRTGAQIHFPDPSNPQKKSTVYLQGTIESVCLARQYLMGCLPLVLMFDMKEEIDVEPHFITELMEQLDVFISIKPKPKQPSKSVIVKSVERNALNMYEARKCLLGLESSGVPIAASPSTVSCPVGLSCPGLDILSSAGLGLTGLGLLGPTALSVNTSATPNSLLNALNSSVSPLQSPSSGTPSPTLWASSITNTTATGFSAIPHLMMPSTAQATLTSILLSGVPNYSQNTPSPPPGLTPVDIHVNGMQAENKKSPTSLNGHVKTSTMKYTASLGENVLGPNHSDPSRQTSSHSASEQVTTKANAGEGCNDAFVEVGMPRSPSHSANASDLKQMMSSSKQSCAKRQTVELLQGTKNSHLHTTERLLSDSELSASENPVADKKAPGSERAAERAAAAQQNSERARLAPQSSYMNMQAFDYEQKKLLATKAMLKKPVVTEVRTPTNTWSGLGFSKSMPAETIKELRRANHVPYKPSMSTTYEGSSMSLSRSNSREHLGSGSDSDNWRDHNGIGPTAPGDFVSSIGSPKRKQNKSTEHYLSSSNYMDCISSLTGSNGCNLNSLFKGSDLPELFSKLGLGKYTDIFQQQEIDLQTFLTLTDQDLKELGITTFGARRKMLLAISELNKNRRKLFDPSNVRASFLEGGASGRLPRQYHSDIASVSGRW